MRYAVAIEGQPDVLESLARCLNSSLALLHQMDGEWVLESSDFHACRSADEVFEVAASLLARINTIFAIYASLPAPLAIGGSVLTFSDSGKQIRRRLRVLGNVTVYSSAGLRELSSAAGSETLACALLARAASDSAIAEALALVEGRPLKWPQIYDVIEFLGGAKEIERIGFATETAAERIRRTANHYRHEGSRKPYPLPANPPTLREGQAFARDLLKKWLAKRI